MSANIVGSDTWAAAEARVRRHAPKDTPEEVINQAIRETAETMLAKAVQALREHIYKTEAGLLRGDRHGTEETNDV